MDALMNTLGFHRQTIHLFVGGGPSVGKTYCCRKFSEENGIKAGSTSDIVISRLAAELFDCGVSPDHYVDYDGTLILGHIRENKERFRWLLESVGDRICKEDPGALAGALISSGVTAIDGIRRTSELKHILARYPDNHVYWVQREGYPKKKDNTNLDLDWIEMHAKKITIISNDF